MESKVDKSRPTGVAPRPRSLLALLVGLILIGATVGCSQADTASETAAGAATSDRQIGPSDPQVVPTEPQPDQTIYLVRPVELQESAGRYTPELANMSNEARSFNPPSEVAVYEVSPSEAVTRESMDTLATKLGIGEDRQYAESGLSGPGGSLECPRADDAQCFMFKNSVVGDAAFAVILAGVPPQPVSPEETRAIADSYLASLGMLDEHAFLGTRDGMAYGTLTQSGEEKRWVIEMRADYQAYVGGVPLVGAGSKVQVDVAPDGTVTRFCHLAQTASLSEEKVAIRPVAAALDDLKQGKGEVPPDIDSERARNISIESIEVCYYAPPAPLARMYYKPVYVFHVRMTDGTPGDWLLPAFEGSMAEGAI